MYWTSTSILWTVILFGTFHSIFSLSALLFTKEEYAIRSEVQTSIDVHFAHTWHSDCSEGTVSTVSIVYVEFMSKFKYNTEIYFSPFIPGNKLKRIEMRLYRLVHTVNNFIRFFCRFNRTPEPVSSQESICICTARHLSASVFVSVFTSVTLFSNMPMDKKAQNKQIKTSFEISDQWKRSGGFSRAYLIEIAVPKMHAINAKHQKFHGKCYRIGNSTIKYKQNIN